MKKFLILWLFVICPHLAIAQSNQFQPQSNVNVGPADCSGAIIAGNVAQNAFPAAANRKGFQIMNFDTTEPLWISFTGTAAPNTIGSYPIAAATATTFAGAGSYYSNIGFNKPLSIIAATTGHKFSCTLW